VGEDFRDLLTGLRHVDEAAHLLALSPGDRLGHGLALAWDPWDFYARRQVAYARTGDHALDLLWAWTLLRDRPEPARGLARTAEDRLRRLVAPGLDRPLGSVLEETAALLSPSEPLGWRRRAVDVGSEVPRPAATEPELLDRLGVPRRDWDRLVALDAGEQDWPGFVSEVQRLVHARVVRRNLVVELNPTSNALVGGFRLHAELPYLALNTFGLPIPEPSGGDIPVSVNTDDPGVFHTTLRNEFERLGQALLDKGLPVRRVTAWLDEARRVGLDSTFIPPWAPAGSELCAHIDRVLQGPRRPPRPSAAAAGYSAPIRLCRPPVSAP